MKRVLITGANRGIGLELVKQYASQDDVHVFAACRNPQAAEALQAVANAHSGRVTVLKLEVTDQQQIEESAEAIRAQVGGLDILINNAAINPRDGVQDFPNMTAETFLEVLHINSVAPLMIAQVYADLLQQAKVVNVSSERGSMQGRTDGREHAYCASKAALNMVTRGLAVNLQPMGAVVITIHPGWVVTDMGGPNARLQPDESVGAMVELIDGLSAENNGLYYQWDGQPLPW